MSLAEVLDTRGADPSDKKLTDTEFEIGRKYMGRLPWEMVAWGLGNFVVWLSLWPLVLSGEREYE